MDEAKITVVEIDKSYCENCDKYEYVFEVRGKDGCPMIRLCKDCLLELLDAIVRR